MARRRSASDRPFRCARGPLAVLVLVARHAVVPRPSLAARLLTPLRRLAARDALRANHRLATGIDRVLVGLVGLALVLDLTGGLSGAAFALAALALLIVRQATFAAPSLAEQLRAHWGPIEWRFEAPTRREWRWAVLLFAGATALFLRQQVLADTRVPDLGDPLFSMWRIAWVAHQLPLDPRHLFDANIFHPTARSLAYSDAMLLPALLAAPALWLGAPLAVVYTSLLLFSYVAARVSMFALAKGVTRHTGAGVIAGLVFAFDPFRTARP